MLFVTAEKPVDHISVRGPSALLHGRTISFLVGGGADHPSYSPDRFEFEAALSEDGIAVLALGDGQA